MIAYSKGNMEILLDINLIWSLIFMLLYYFMAIFLLHAAFHNSQTDAVKNIVLLYSLEKTDVVEDEVVDVVEKSMYQKKREAR